MKDEGSVVNGPSVLQGGAQDVCAEGKFLPVQYRLLWRCCQIHLSIKHNSFS